MTRSAAAVYPALVGVPNATDQLVRDYQGLVRSIAQKLHGQLDLTCELEDLVAFGNKGLVEAAGRYDASRGVQFNTFAYYRIRGAVLDGVRAMAYLPRRAHARLRAAEARDDVTESIGEARAATPEVRGDVSATVTALDEALGRLTASYVMAAVGQGEDDKPTTPEEAVISAELRTRVAKALAKLPERERALVQGFYFEGRKFDEVAKELGVSKSWASRLHGKALALLKESLAE